ncbi:MAG: VOC family protein [Acidobacteriaceae bacterium]|mgnify:CR=1 FL=1|jgi:glyoxylase I family protein
MAIEVRGVCPLLQVYDMPTAVRFYRDKLGFDVVNTSPLMAPEKFHWCLLRLGSAEIMLNTAYEFDHERPVPADRARVAAHDDTCLYFGCPDVDGMYEELREKGVAVKPPKVAPYGMKQLGVRDPDGFNLCFQWQAEE